MGGGGHRLSQARLGESAEITPTIISSEVRRELGNFLTDLKCKIFQTKSFTKRDQTFGDYLGARNSTVGTARALRFFLGDKNFREVKIFYHLKRTGKFMRSERCYSQVLNMAGTGDRDEFGFSKFPKIPFGL